VLKRKSESVRLSRSKIRRPWNPCTILPVSLSFATKSHVAVPSWSDDEQENYRELRDLMDQEITGFEIPPATCRRVGSNVRITGYFPR